MRSQIRQVVFSVFCYFVIYLSWLNFSSGKSASISGFSMRTKYLNGHIHKGNNPDEVLSREDLTLHETIISPTLCE